MKNGDRFRILFIDDDEVLLQAFRQYFQKLGHEVATAATGREGVNAFTRFQPEVTIIDLKLPDISGMEVLTEVRRRGGVAVMLTGMGDVATAVEAMRLGADNYLTKPMEMNQLAVVVEKSAEKLRLRRENRELRARLNPSLKRRMLRAGVFVVLVLVSAALGLLIGSSENEDPRERVPIPVPIESDS